MAKVFLSAGHGGSDPGAVANASGADIAVSFHANAGGGDGFEAFYYSSDANGKRLAQLLNTEDSGLYRVQVGAYKEKSNADAMLRKLKMAGFSGILVAS